MRGNREPTRVTVLSSTVAVLRSSVSDSGSPSPHQPTPRTHEPNIHEPNIHKPSSARRRLAPSGRFPSIYPDKFVSSCRGLGVSLDSGKV